MTETWLTSNTFNKEILPNGFNIYRNDRHSRGGGVLLAINDIIPSVPLTTPPGLEAVTIKIGQKSPIVISVLYIAPQSSSDYYNEFFDYIISLANSSLPVIIMGDFNLPDINWSTLTASTITSNQFCEIIFKANLVQLVDQPTHILGNILDLVLTNTDDTIQSLTIQDNNNLTSLHSDHYIIKFRVFLQVLNNKVTASPSYVLNFKRANYDEMCEYLFNSEINSITNSNNIEQIWQTIKYTILQAINMFVPKKGKKLINHLFGLQVK